MDKISLALILFYVLVSTIGMGIVKAGANDLGAHAIINLKVLLGGTIVFLSFFVLVGILKRNDISSVYPTVQGLSILLVAIMGFITFKEPFCGVRLSGIILMIIAIFLISKS